MPIKTLFHNHQCEWVDVDAPTQEDLNFLQERYEINKLLLQDTVDPNHLPKYEEADHVKFFLTRENTELERLNLNSISDVSTKLGIFIIGKTIITVHRLNTQSIIKTKSELDASKTPDIITVERIALRIAHKVIKTFDTESINILELLDKIESEIFLKKTSHTNQIKRLYKLKRKTGLNLRILNISSEWVQSFNKLPLDHVEVMDLVDKQKDAIADFEHLNQQVTNLIGMFLAISDQKNNESMKILSMYSVYFLPITFIAGVYGMNFHNMPELEQKYGYYVCLTVMILIVLFTFIYFRRKRM
ncbi:magnesium transporter CorA [Elizabethkingia meningoseptica]|uniref:Magnesium transporter CorA n=3 Tax=Elizabethkingia meningoseptica TaxID=238 RepID=A0A1V3U0P9_ELIME|nr:MULTISPECIES: CorA family divalent cation transporter [Elizabethkingia]AQX06122.1 magnesium transporter CorA [Elizabethkingia meningoseptica]AQX13663.1 magnesium transporter CorA [Elizabethkingia meningoseptica]AQX48168.1 magnesium transporter CorA [Elizabethkingia meningoseptica]EOR30225.1 Mg2+ and Co2+ transporter [Elizabethkingia meningoseptica ATCC 13253 = NBRC 12535]KUY23355.1 magnesium transporter CorA [Elizabethkingia meningoseptica]